MASEFQPRRCYHCNFEITLRAVNLKWRDAGPLAAACLFFLLAGLAFLPLLGIEDDEALFAGPLFSPLAAIYHYRFLHWRPPIMLMSYLGCLKTWIYAPLFRLFGIDVWTVRAPMLLAGAGSLCAFHFLLRRVAGARAAAVGTVMLAADACYLLTTCFDWGPVALQHLLIVTGMLLIVRFAQDGGLVWLALGCFLFGLALWDKALAVWLLSAMGLAAFAVFPRRVLQALRPRVILVAVAALSLGALPLILYNAHTHLDTFRGNTRRDVSDLPNKASMLLHTLNGQALFGYLTAEDFQTPSPHPVSGALESAAASIASVAHDPRESWMGWALALAILLTPLAGAAAIRANAFALIAMLVAWVEMATTKGTGGSVHHSILLWPLPQWIVAVALAGVSRRFGKKGFAALAAVSALLVASELLVMDEYYVEMARNGASLSWTDAIYALDTYLAAPHPPENKPWQGIYCVDWGVLDILRMLSAGALPLRVGTLDSSPPEMTEADLKELRHMISDSGHVFVTHTEGSKYFPASDQKLQQGAAAMGYSRKFVASVKDSFGRRTFQLYTFVPSQPAK
jgi:4-amino-4-deoxy-L-arabinose transferase-like glycosyltransferase